jgi:hypothetical protein
MCLTTTTSLIDFNRLTTSQKKKLKALKAKLQARHKAHQASKNDHQKRIAEIGRGLKVLKKKMG